MKEFEVPFSAKNTPSEEELKKFVASNDWNVQQTIAVMGLFE